MSLTNFTSDSKEKTQQKTIQDIFKEYIQRKPIFKDKNVLTLSYTPENIPYRDEQITQLSTILAPALKNERPSNVFIYGSPGTGKTLVSQKVTSELENMAVEIGVEITCLYVNAKMKKVADTEYRLIAHLSNLLGEHVPSTGLPTDEVYRRFFSVLKKKKGPVIIIIDEIDALVSKVGDEFLYNFTRINNDITETHISIIGISNNLLFTDYLDARVRSSLSEEEILFPPYNAIELQQILKERAEKSINEGKYEEGVIAKCAALAAQEHGDARRALDLLRVAGEIAERENANRIEVKHVDIAENKVDMDRILESVKTQPKQSKLVLKTILESLIGKNKNKILTGDVYDKYVSECKELSYKPLTQRRVSDIISELDILGIINAKVISNGRYGRTREISLINTDSTNNKILNYLNKELI